MGERAVSVLCDKCAACRLLEQVSELEAARDKYCLKVQELEKWQTDILSLNNGLRFQTAYVGKTSRTLASSWKRCRGTSSRMREISRWFRYDGRTQCLQVMGDWSGATKGAKWADSADYRERGNVLCSYVAAYSQGYRPRWSRCELSWMRRLADVQSSKNWLQRCGCWYKRVRVLNLSCRLLQISARPKWLWMNSEANLEPWNRRLKVVKIHRRTPCLTGFQHNNILWLTVLT